MRTPSWFCRYHCNTPAVCSVLVIDTTPWLWQEKELTEISLLREFIRLRYLDFKKNQIVDLSPLAVCAWERINRES